MMVNDKGIQAVLKEVDNHELALALKTASEKLQGKILGNMSERAASLIREDMQFMGPVRVSDVEGAQQRVVDIVRRLELWLRARWRSSLGERERLHPGKPGAR